MKQPTTYKGSAVLRSFGATFIAGLLLAFLLLTARPVFAGSTTWNVNLTSGHPASGGWTATGSLATGRYAHTATLLPNGRVLVAGSWGDEGILASAELYDPASGTWTATGSLATARNLHTATLLPNGKVLVAGGQGIDYNPTASAELYDLVSGTWSPTGSLAAGRVDHTATLLPDGKVLVAGGYDRDALASAELYDPASATWSATGSLATARTRHTGDVAAQRQGARRRW